MAFRLFMLLWSSVFLLSIRAASIPEHALLERRELDKPMTGTPKNEIPATSLTLSDPRFQPFRLRAQFAKLAYCPPEIIKHWERCETCKATGADFRVVLADGDGNKIQYFFVGLLTLKEEKIVVVSYQGTNPTKLRAIVTDLDFMKVPLSEHLFPEASKKLGEIAHKRGGIPVHDTSLLAHHGFHGQFEFNGERIYKEVEKLVLEHRADKVITVGHSLGGALAIIAALSFRLRFEHSKNVRLEHVQIESTTFGAPRVGNYALADLIANMVTLNRVNSLQDVVPVVPPMVLGYHSPPTEIRLVHDVVYECKGIDNMNRECQAGAVPYILEALVKEKAVQAHLGPYFGEKMPLINPEC